MSRSICRRCSCDLNGLAMWMAYSTFFARLDTMEIANYYSKLFAKMG